MLSAAEKPNAKVVGVVGVKEGVGTTTLATNLSIVLRRETNQSVLFIDLDVDCQGEAAFVLGSEQQWRSIEELLPMLSGLNPALLSGFITKHPKEIDLLKLQKKSDSWVEVSQLKSAFSLLLQSYDYIIMDMGARWNQWNVLASSFCSEIWMVARADYAAVGMMEKKFNQLKKAYYPGSQTRFIINHWLDEVPFPLESLQEKLGRRPDAILPHDATRFAEMAINGMPIVCGDLRHAWTRQVERLVSENMQQSKMSAAVELSLQWDKSLTEVSSVPGSVANSSLQKNKPAIARENMSAESYVRDPERELLKEEILEKLLRKMNLKVVGQTDEVTLRTKTTEVIIQIIDEFAKEREMPQDRKRLVREVLHEALGLGPLEDLLSDDSVSEIMAVSKDEIYIEQKGKIKLAPISFTSNRQMMRVIERIVAPIGRRVDESSPMVDARLKDGSRVNIVIPPLALKGPAITIRRFAKEKLTHHDLIGFGAMTEEMATFLRAAIEARLNIVVAGGTGSGKTTLLNVLSSFIPEDERIITIEDSAELQMQQPHVVRLESRPPNIEGRGAIEIRDLVRNALRMRPDRVVIGECRSGEALDMLQAMNTGHDGSLTTLHANTPRDTISRLETLVMFAGVELPSRAIREQIAGAVDLIVQLKRLQDGSRKVVQVTEVGGMEGDVIILQDIFSFQQDRLNQSGKVEGRFTPTGFIPLCLDTLKQHGCAIDHNFFQQNNAAQAGGML